jgi:hypothetical protein
MDFIEKIFGFFPDGGSGAFEVLLFVIPIVGLYLLYQRRSSSAEETSVVAGAGGVVI